MEKAPLTINFPNEVARKHFMQWLDSAHAEDGYAIWMDAREYEDQDTEQLTVLRKKMDYETGVITVTCGRLDSR